jgi:hypothetical protein
MAMQPRCPECDKGMTLLEYDPRLLWMCKQCDLVFTYKDEIEGTASTPILHGDWAIAEIRGLRNAVSKKGE